MQKDATKGAKTIINAIVPLKYCQKGVNANPFYIYIKIYAIMNIINIRLAIKIAPYTAETNRKQDITKSSNPRITILIKYLKFSKNPSNPLSRILKTQTIK